MAYIAPTIKDRVAVGDNKYTMQTLSDGRVLLTPSPDEVEEAGTEINKALLQPLVDAVALAWTKLQSLANIATSGSFNDLIDIPVKIAVGQYTGAGKYGINTYANVKANARAITLPFAPIFVLLISNESMSYPLILMQGNSMCVSGSSASSRNWYQNALTSGSDFAMILSGNKLYVTKAGQGDGWNRTGGDASGIKYAYAAFA